jgi:preprotein translocase subunit YajC
VYATTGRRSGKRWQLIQHHVADFSAPDDFGVLAVFHSPAIKKSKKSKKFIEEIGKGDKIVTIAGIHGTINKVNEDGTLQIEVSPGSYLKIEKSAISMDWTAALNKPAATTAIK